MNTNKIKKRIIVLFDLITTVYIILGMYLLFFKTVGFIIGDDYNSKQLIKGISLLILLAIFIRSIILLTRISKKKPS